MLALPPCWRYCCVADSDLRTMLSGQLVSAASFHGQSPYLPAIDIDVVQ